MNFSIFYILLGNDRRGASEDTYQYKRPKRAYRSSYNMKAMFLLALIMIGAPFLATHVMASPYIGTCPNNQGGSINATD
jgi:hypothetical protein